MQISSIICAHCQSEITNPDWFYEDIEVWPNHNLIVVAPEIQCPQCQSIIYLPAHQISLKTAVYRTDGDPNSPR